MGRNSGCPGIAKAKSNFCSSGAAVEVAGKNFSAAPPVLNG